jgi:hypothetical protein
VGALQTVFELADTLADVIAGSALAEEADNGVGCFCRSSGHFVSVVLSKLGDGEVFVK